MRECHCRRETCCGRKELASSEGSRYQLIKQEGYQNGLSILIPALTAMVWPRVAKSSTALEGTRKPIVTTTLTSGQRYSGVEGFSRTTIMLRSFGNIFAICLHMLGESSFEETSTFGFGLYVLIHWAVATQSTSHSRWRCTFPF